MLGDLGDKISRLEGVRSKYLRDESSLEDEIKKIEHQMSVLEQASEAIKTILQALIHEDKESIRAIITEGLQAIFEDQDLSLKIDSSIKRGKVNIDFLLTDGMKGIEGDVLDSFGGGVANIVSLLFRFIASMKLKLYPFLALDESLGNVSEEYIDNAGSFLKSLCKKTQFDVLLVTHQPKFLSFADTAYAGDLDGSKLVLKEIKGP